jgi:hypothetical protein
MIKPNIKAMFRELNEMHFNGEVPDIPVVWNSRMTTTAGQCRFRGSLYSRRPLGIDLSEKLFRNMDYDVEKVTRTLIHEMVHAYLLHKFNDKGHSVRFQRMMTDITGEHKNHRCHSYDVEGLKRTQAKKVQAECGRCGVTYQKARMPKHANESRYTHRGCGGVVTFRRMEPKSDEIKMF